MFQLFGITKIKLQKVLFEKDSKVSYKPWSLFVILLSHRV
jgi:hypothetical protein